MLNNSKFFYKLNNKNLLLNTSKKLIASKRHNTYFDIQVDWFMKFLISKKMTFCGFLAAINVSLFIYANFRYGWESRWKAIEGVSYSLHTLKMKDYTNIFTSQLGSYRIDDLILETGILFSLGHNLEKLYGRPFMFKLFVFSFYIGFLSSLYWVRLNSAKRKRYHVEEPYERNVGRPETFNNRYMSSHTFCMSIVYFYLYKHPVYRYMILPILATDLYIWGPYYSSGALTGLAAAIIL